MQKSAADDINRLTTLLVCPECTADFRAEDMKIICTGCGRAFSVRDGKAFFIEPAGDIKPTFREDAKNPSRWTRWRKTNHAFFRDSLEALSSNSVLLDIGVGQAHFSDLFGRFEKRLAADFFPYPDANLICDLTKRLPIRDNGCDIATASNVLEHLPDGQAVLAECHRVLKHGGQLFGTIPFLTRVHQEPYDFHRYTHFMLKKLLEEAGFTEIDVRDLGTPYDAYLQLQLHFFYYLFDLIFSYECQNNRGRFHW